MFRKIRGSFAKTVFLRWKDIAFRELGISKGPKIHYCRGKNTGNHGFAI